jgi:hypothetical protein
LLCSINSSRISVTDSPWTDIFPSLSLLEDG